MQIDFFQSCGHCWVFQICWHIECSTLIASSFRILNSSAGIPSFPVDFWGPLDFTLQNVWLCMSDHTFNVIWVIKIFCIVHLCILAIFFLISSSIRALLFLSFIVLVFGWNIPLMSPFFLTSSLVIPLLLLSSISLHCSLKALSPSFSLDVCLQLGVPFLSLLLFASLLFSAILKLP